MATRYAAAGRWDGGKFYHEEWVSGVDTLLDPDGNPIGGTIYFTDLGDTPGAYVAGDALKVVRVNATFDGLEFAVGGGGASTLQDAYTGGASITLTNATTPVHFIASGSGPPDDGILLDDQVYLKLGASPAQSQIYQNGAVFYCRTVNSGVDSSAIQVITGDSSSLASGDISLTTGGVTGGGAGTGSLSLTTGTNSSTGPSGNISFQTGAPGGIGAKGVVHVVGTRLELDAHAPNVGLRLPTTTSPIADAGTTSQNGDLVLRADTDTLYFRSSGIWHATGGGGGVADLQGAYDGGRTILLTNTASPIHITQSSTGVPEMGIHHDDWVGSLYGTDLDSQIAFDPQSYLPLEALTITTAVATTSASIVVGTGSSGGVGNSGEVRITTGDAASGASGWIVLQTGSFAGTRGDIHLSSRYVAIESATYGSFITPTEKLDIDGALRLRPITPGASENGTIAWDTSGLDFVGRKGGIWVSLTAGSGTGVDNTASNLGAQDATHRGLWKQKIGGDLQFKSIQAGTGITLDNTPSDFLVINATGGGGGSLDDAYNNGRVITVDAGAIELVGIGSMIELDDGGVLNFGTTAPNRGQIQHTGSTLYVQTEFHSTAAPSRPIEVRTGTAGASQNTGAILLKTGPGTGASGAIALETGNISSGAGSSGSIRRYTGSVVGTTRGNIYDRSEHVILAPELRGSPTYYGGVHLIIDTNPSSPTFNFTPSAAELLNVGGAIRLSDETPNTAASPINGVISYSNVGGTLDFWARKAGAWLPLTMPRGSATGQIAYWNNVTSTWGVLSNQGLSGQVLTSQGTSSPPTWTTVSGGTPTLQLAYDGAGSGAGRTINIFNSGTPVLINAGSGETALSLVGTSGLVGMSIGGSFTYGWDSAADTRMQDTKRINFGTDLDGYITGTSFQMDIVGAAIGTASSDVNITTTNVAGVAGSILLQTGTGGTDGHIIVQGRDYLDLRSDNTVTLNPQYGTSPQDVNLGGGNLRFGWGTSDITGTVDDGSLMIRTDTDLLKVRENGAWNAVHTTAQNTTLGGGVGVLFSEVDNTTTFRRIDDGTGTTVSTDGNGQILINVAQAWGEMYVQTGTYLALPGILGPVPMNAAGILSGIGFSTPFLLPEVPGVYEVEYGISISPDGTLPQVWETYVFVNGLEVTPNKSRQRQHMSAPAVGETPSINISGNCLITIGDGETVALFTQEILGGGNGLVSYANLTMHLLG